MKIINLKKRKENEVINKEQEESYENVKIYYICKKKEKKKIENKYLKDKKYCKVRDHCHYNGEYGVLCKAYVI